MRPGNTLIPAVIVILAISATVGVYAFSVWPTDKELNVNSVQVRQPRNTNGSSATNTNSTIASNSNTSVVVNTNISSDEVMKDWKTYESKDYAFSFRYPKDWILDTNPALSVGAGVTAPVSNSIIYVIPDGSTGDDSNVVSTEKVTVAGQAAIKTVRKNLGGDNLPNYDRYILSTFRASGWTANNNITVIPKVMSDSATLQLILSTLVISDPTKDWKTYENKDLKFSFKYPTEYGDVKFFVANGDTGKKFNASFSNTTAIEFGGVNGTFSEGRGGYFMDCQGFVKEGDVYYYKFVGSGKVKITPIKEVQGVNMSSLLLKGEGKNSAADPGDNAVGAVINLPNNGQFLGLAIRTLDLKKISQEKFEEILSTFTFTN